MMRSPALVLIAEDSAVVSMTVEDELEEAGLKIGGCFVRGSDALRWLETNSPTVAVLDYILRDGPCDALALALKARGISTIFYSGQSASERPVEFVEAVWLEKPCSMASISEAVRQALRNRRSTPRHRTKAFSAKALNRVQGAVQQSPVGRTEGKPDEPTLLIAG